MKTKLASKQDWDVNPPTWETVNVGSLQRIAAATEAMAQNWVRLTSDVEYYKKLSNERMARVVSRDRSIANLRGQITKLKKKAGAQ